MKGKSRFQLLMSRLPSDHKARWMAGSALNAADQAMASVLSTAMSRLNVFLDSEMEQVLCFDSSLDAEAFVRGALRHVPHPPGGGHHQELYGQPHDPEPEPELFKIDGRQRRAASQPGGAVLR